MNVKIESNYETKGISDSEGGYPSERCYIPKKEEKK